MWRDLSAAPLETEPFCHVIIDDACERPDELLAVVDEEGVEAYESDIFKFEATAPEPRSPEFRALRDAFAAELAPALSRLTGRAVTRCDMRAYAYRPGHYLLPHTDHQDGLLRQLARTRITCPPPSRPTGGELELFAGMRSAKLIAPRDNRLVIFEVGDTSLHQVREVLSGLRISLAGWFYA